LPFFQHARLVAHSIGRQILHQGFFLACLPYEAFISLRAISCTSARMLITDRRLLEWRTASDAQRTASTNLAGFYSSMWVLPLSAIVVAATLSFERTNSLIAAGPVIALWFISPAIAFWLSRATK